MMLKNKKRITQITHIQNVCRIGEAQRKYDLHFYLSHPSPPPQNAKVIKPGTDS